MQNTINHLWTISSGGLHSRQRQLDVLSHNIANSNTVGFKASQSGFQALVRERVLSEDEAAVFVNANAGDVIQEGMGTFFSHSTRLFSQGSLQQTNNQHHLAINGDGFFQLTDPAGQQLYTRAGDFQRDAEGRLVNSQGYRLQPQVTVPANVGEIYIDPAGQVFGRADGEAKPALFGQIQLAIFANPDGLESVGDSALIATEASGAAQIANASQGGRGNLMAGYLENSNVDLANEMTELLRSQRAYSLGLRSLHIADEIFRMANEMPRS